MQAALQKLITADAEAIEEVDALAAILPLPVNVKCSDLVCSQNFAQQCAYSYWPKANGPDLGDWMKNGTEPSKWANKACDGNRICDKKYEKTDYQWAKYCSMADQRRGYFGGPDDGPFSLGFTNMNHCTIWIAESYYDSTKPLYLANWAEELEIKVNGQVCTTPDCKIVHAATTYEYSQTLIIDAKSMLGGKCRREEVRVDLTVKPVGPHDQTCAPNGQNDCKPAGNWVGYHDDLCGGRGLKGPNCSAPPRYQNSSDIRTYFSYAIAF
jgi:hypothetical protein